MTLDLTQLNPTSAECHEILDLLADIHTRHLDAMSEEELKAYLAPYRGEREQSRSRCEI